MSIAVLLRIHIVWNVMLCYKPSDTLSYPRRRVSPEYVFPVPFSVSQALLEQTDIIFEVTVILKILC